MKKCKFCQNGSHNAILNDSANQDLAINIETEYNGEKTGPTLWASDIMDSLICGQVDINYCPMCGRKLQ